MIQISEGTCLKIYLVKISKVKCRFSTFLVRFIHSLSCFERGCYNILCIGFDRIGTDREI